MKSIWFPIILGIIILIVIVTKLFNHNASKRDNNPELLRTTTQENDPTIYDWLAPEFNTDSSLTVNQRKELQYGEDLIAHTARYFGPKGSIAHIANGMNCQNCHLEAGKQPWANNFALTYSKYPRTSSRSGKIQTLYDRVNGCFQRSMNGQKLDTSTHEMQAMVEYISYLGKRVKKGQQLQGAGLVKINFIGRAADPKKGEGVYITFCQRCHGDNGRGKINETGNEYTYPPLWGIDSYNDGAGLYRLSNFASFVKSNMPYGVTSHWSPSLTQEQAWDVAAFVNSQPRPHKDQNNDYPDLDKKPFDAPYGPYADAFSEPQHKYGPYQSIIANVDSNHYNKK